VRFARFDLLGRVLEVREGDFGDHLVLVDGRVVSHKSMGFWVGGSSHFFELASEEGEKLHIEVQVRGWRFRFTPAFLLADGAELAALELVSRRHMQRRCPYCVYSLVGLTVENNEVKCPECGRHSSLAVLGLKKGAKIVPRHARDLGA